MRSACVSFYITFVLISVLCVFLAYDFIFISHCLD